MGNEELLELAGELSTEHAAAHARIARWSREGDAAHARGDDAEAQGASLAFHGELEAHGDLDHGTELELAELEPDATPDRIALHERAHELAREHTIEELRTWIVKRCLTCRAGLGIADPDYCAKCEADTAERREDEAASSFGRYAVDVASGRIAGEQVWPA